MIWSVFCPYGNMYPEHSVGSIGLTLLSSITIIVFCCLTYSWLFQTHLTTTKKIILIVLGAFTAITFILNVALSQW